MESLQIKSLIRGTALMLQGIIKPGNNGARKKAGVGEIILTSAKYIWASCFTHS